MDFDVELKGNIYSKQSLNGNIKFIVHNGKMSTLGKLEHLLYAQNVIADNMLRTSLSVVTKAITLKNTGLFKYLRGDIKLTNGIANINMLQSQGPSMALYMKGQYNPMNDYAQLMVLGRLSDEIISGLGAFGEFSFNKLMIMLTGEDNKYKVITEDFDKIPQLSVKNTKEFMSIIDGNIDKPSSVILFNWIAYSQKSLRQKEVPMTNVKLPEFLDDLPD
ncbi:MAG: AsmA-like C-terminal region-containing protein [bacterium]|nr:AsmA-like C-terminal region-containing protein [bacterium]